MISVKIKTECELLDEIFDLSFEALTLGGLKEEDCASYARLIQDEKTNEFWGYDYKEDFNENVCDSFFIENAKTEFLRGESLTLAIRHNGIFVGEATLYAFDGMGSAEMAIRLLPESRGKQLGNLSFEALTEYARRIGLSEITAFVDKRNKVSLSYLGKNMEKVSETQGRVKFSCALIN